MSITTLKVRVEDLLRDHLYLRDNDVDLIQVIWNEDLIRNGYTPTDITFDQAAHFIHNKVVSRPDSITRARRIVQEMNVNLRGRTWYSRHNLQEPAVQQEIRAIKNSYR